jgi:hypothetical protein
LIVQRYYSPIPENLPLLTLFRVCSAALGLYILTKLNAHDLAVQLTGCLIVFLSLIPAYLWCAKKVAGLPVYPPFALSHVATCGLPLIHMQKSVARYEASIAIQAGLTICAFLILTTLVWYLIVRRPIRPPHSVLVLVPGMGPLVLLGYLSIACGIQVAIQARWLDLSPGMFSMVRASGLALGVLATAGLAHELGARSLSSSTRLLFFMLIGTYLVVQTVSLYLSAAFMTTLIGVIAFSATRRRLPLGWLMTVLLITMFLQPGKSEMRDWVWHRNSGITPLEYPDFFGRWAQASLSNMPLISDKPPSTHHTKQSSLERASIIHMVMLVEKRSPDPKPFLNGQTYAVIPQLLVPRALDPDKPRALIGQYILCIYYGLQTPAQAMKTAIAFGLPAEAYANFGYPGIIGLALILGCAHGFVTRYCFALPVLSLRTLFALVFIGLSLRHEASGAVVVTTLIQALAVLFAATWFIMTPWRLANLRLHRAQQRTLAWPEGPLPRTGPQGVYPSLPAGMMSQPPSAQPPTGVRS